MSAGLQAERHQIEVDDQIQLNALVYRKFDVKQYSSILIITPYRAERYDPDGHYFRDAGFVLVAVDSRGCGASQGRFEPFERDGEDARHVIKWIIQQPWSNGRVGLYGGSYSGFIQWATCCEPVPGLKSMAPVASVYPGVDFPSVNGLMYLYASRWLAYIDSRTKDQRYLDNDYWARCLSNANLSHPEALVASAAGQAETMRRWLALGDHPDFWKSLVPCERRMSEIDTPMLFITGTYDDDQRGTLEYYRKLNPSQRTRALLVIGPWDHDGTRQPSTRFGGLEYGDDSCLDLSELHRQWYTWTLDGGPRPALCRSPVMFYMAGSERWHYASSLEDMTTTRLTWYLNDVSGLGALPTPTPTVTHIPKGETPPIGNVMGHKPTYAGPQQLLAQVPGTTFISPMFDQALRLCGEPQVLLYLRTSADCADICATLFALLPDQTALYLGTSNRRIRQGGKLAAAQSYEFDGFNLVCRELPSGSRLQINISLSDSSIWLCANTEDTQVELLHGGIFPSALIMPLQPPKMSIE
ncbi:CocE/NonD family hydrolase [Pseudomonas citronellolis]|uniref:CocE/NonD family hydrolase n=1 Tax=Pseudomonas citronellolis TaxID=53408 RepID=UPI00264A10FD|nr:CocE/NonD family hydrolase [Pseudomonas citronellolis]MDN6875430.1 CocE/NonD family hydrolase [Pseudomonas citronellolis]